MWWKREKIFLGLEDPWLLKNETTIWRWNKGCATPKNLIKENYRDADVVLDALAQENEILPERNLVTLES